ncbi:MAG: aldo/keto reductase [Oscillospiraceae bacterium]|nr:aldo/keto reductase [Oscillospiraceae bacterium]
MQKREISKLGITVSRLGFGGMRMPEKDGQVDYPQTEAMIDYLLENGVTYYDTAWFYHGGQSEPFLRKALVERHPRDSFTVATKLPLGECNTLADAERVFETQCKNLGVETIDFYLLHGIGAEGWAKAKALGLPDFLRRLKAEGKIRFAGFSFHDKNETLPPILDDNQWDFCQVQINYADWHQRGADTLYQALADREIPIIVMEPVRGGGLTRLYPEMEAVLRGLDPEPSLASWALRFCATLPHVDVILSGMSSMEQCRDNVNTFSHFTSLKEAELEGLRGIAQAFDKLPLIPCTQCRYCADCPQGIDIAELFGKYNRFMQYQQGWGLHNYVLNTPEEHKATACVQCGYCESRCPQGIEIPKELVRVHEAAVRLVG